MRREAGEAVLGRSPAQSLGTGLQSRSVAGPKPSTPDSQIRAVPPWQGMQETQNSRMKSFKGPRSLSSSVQSCNLPISFPPSKCSWERLL